MSDIEVHLGQFEAAAKGVRSQGQQWDDSTEAYKSKVRKIVGDLGNDKYAFQIKSNTGFLQVSNALDSVSKSLNAFGVNVDGAVSGIKNVEENSAFQLGKPMQLTSGDDLTVEE